MPYFMLFVKDFMKFFDLSVWIDRSFFSEKLLDMTIK